MKIQVLPGDAIVETFKKTEIEGEIIICRECLIDGPVKADSLEEFWRVRADFIDSNYGQEKTGYFSRVVSEFEKLRSPSIDGQAEINLWFEYELFCQVNLWFCLYLLRESEAAVYRVAPIVRAPSEIWKGFGRLGANDLKTCYEQRMRFSEADLLLGTSLWEAYQNADLKRLEELSETEAKCFPHLKEVCQAEIEKDFRPEKILREITEADGSKDFAEIFSAFSARAGVYGFGDTQVKRIVNRGDAL